MPPKRWEGLDALMLTVRAKGGQQAGLEALQRHLSASGQVLSLLLVPSKLFLVRRFF